MSFFKPRWESKDPEKIRKWIHQALSSNRKDQRILSKIALQCPYPDMRQTAAGRLFASDLRKSAVIAAKRKGNADLLSMLSLYTATLEEV